MSSGSDWSWPPKEKAIKLAAKAGDLDSRNIKQCFNLKDVPQLRKGDSTKHPMAAHCCIFARIDDSEALIECLDNINRKAAIMMQLRFDGALGFPGGVIDDADSNAVEGLNRELDEEMGLDLGRFRVTDEDFVCCHYIPHEKAESEAKTLRYFYAKEVTLKEYEEIEAASLKAKDYGIEVLGNVRVPLHVFRSSGGLPKFLKNQFPGSAVIIQLFWAIYMKRLLTFEELEFSYDNIWQPEPRGVVI